MKINALLPSFCYSACFKVAFVCVVISIFLQFRLFWSQLPSYIKTGTTVIKQKPRSCFIARFTTDSLLQAQKLPYKYALDSSQTMRYIGDGQVFEIDNETSGKRYRTHAGYQQCLANKHVVLIGDSRARYQYMALVDFLNNGRWMRCIDYRNLETSKNATFDSSCYLIDSEHNRNMTWNDWYSNSSKQLQDDCDCYRQPSFTTQTTFENRYFFTTTPYGPIRITYLQNYVNSIKFHSEFPPLSPWNIDKPDSKQSATNGTRCRPGECSHAPVVTLNTSEALLEMVPKLQPTHVFANMGWWTNQENNPYVIGCVLQKFRVENPQVQSFVISLPALRRDNQSVPVHGCDALVLDLFTVTVRVPPTWYWDNFHALSILNQEFNHMLLDAICGSVEDTDDSVRDVDEV